jgi:hypothetical protein
MSEHDEQASGKIESEAEREPKFTLNRETVADLGADEEQTDEGAASSFSCCIGCNTDGSKSFCNGKTGC